MINTIETIQRQGYTIHFGYDEEPMNPRDRDNVGKMICFHKNYNLGDTHTLTIDMFDNWLALKEYVIKELGAVVILPLQLYDHSGITMSIGSASGFDTGQVGFIYVTQQDIDKEFDGDVAAAEAVLISEVQTYDQFLRGDIYRFDIEDSEGDTVDSCSGFYDKDDMVAEATAIVDSIIKKEIQQRMTKRTQQIKSKVPIEYRDPVISK